MFGRGYMGSILEDKNIYHWEDQAIKFFRTLISSGYDSELERDAYTRYAYQMAQRLRVIPGHDDYDAMSQDLTPFLCRMLGEDDIPSYEDIPTYIHAKFWAFYLFANPGRRTEETFQYLKDNWDEYDCAHILTVLEILDERVLEEPAVAHFHNEFGHYDEDEDLGVIV
jgi:hypothetical protein